jgi:cell division transport system ATP-binding protein
MDFEESFPTIFNTSDKSKRGFDAIVGNPPYVRQELLGDFKPYLKKFYETYHKLNRPTLARLRRRIGVVFQEFRLLEHLTAYENVALPLRVHGDSEKRYRDDVVELLKWVGLGDRLHARPETLSGGEKQRVAIARAVVVKPDLIIADEPTGNVDEEMGVRLLRLFRELNKLLKTTVLIATHDLSMVRKAKAVVLRLADGMVVRVAAAPEAEEATA